jgi:peptidoglycan/xylan/chitin deacetylase (PgdA/CDA1 family)
MKYIKQIAFIGLILATILSACGASPTPVPTETPAPTSTQVPPTATPTETPVPPTATPTPIRTPPALPGVFQSNILNPLDTPHTYVSDTCTYLKNRWDADKAAPGTVVMIIMIHGVAENGTTNLANNGITHGQLKKIAEHLAETGFQSIDSEQLANFMENNARIPERSFMFLVDDRHHSQFYEEHFKPIMQNYGWKTVTNAWISNEALDLSIYSEMEPLAQEGFLDVQAHGFIHNVNITNASSDAYIHQEIYNPIDVITRHFGRRPIAFIWPGGSFTQKAIQVAREAGYRLGFTVNPRGPVMYNWVPLADQNDAGRPSYLAEGTMNDPLMVLPRYWDTDALNKIDEVMTIGDAAATEAGANKDTELLYYDIVCKDQTGPLTQATTTP